MSVDNISKSEEDKEPAKEAGHYSLSLKSVWEGENLSASKSEITRQLAGEAWRAVMAAPFTSIFTVLTMALSMLVFAMSVLLVENLSRGLTGKTRDLQLSVYIRDDVAGDRVKAIAEETKKASGVREVKLVSKDEALKSFRKRLGEQSVLLEGLEQDNPLPRSIEITFSRTKDTEKIFDTFAERFRAMPEVEWVQYNKGLLGQLAAVIRRFRSWGTFSLIGLLMLTAFIIGSTIRLALYSHRDEVSIKRLVGATDRYVSAPYIIEGAVEGLLGAIISLFIADSAVIALQPWISSDPTTALFMTSLEPLSFGSSFFILLIGIVVGVAGSWLSVRGFMRSSDVGIL